MSKQPLQADLLLDTEPNNERDERFAGVYLVDVDEDGEGKTTAERIPGGWQIREWELTDPLDGILGPDRYWFTRWNYQLPDKILASCVNLLLLEKLGEGVPPLPAPVVVPTNAELAPGEFVLGTLCCAACGEKVANDERTGTRCACTPLAPKTGRLAAGQYLHCLECKGPGGGPLTFLEGDTYKLGERGDGEFCPKCSAPLKDLPF